VLANINSNVGNSHKKRHKSLVEIFSSNFDEICIV
jgi:hypothetical protein